MAEVAQNQPVLAELRDGVKWIRLNRPEVRNAIGLDSADAMHAELRSAGEQGARVVVLTGSGGSFCAGADLKSIAAHQGSYSGVRELLIKHYHPLLLEIEQSPLPVIAAVDGPAAGIGCDIALATDLRLASDKAFFAQNFINIGLLPDGGGTFSVPRLAGTVRAMEMAMTGRRINAELALEWGLVNAVLPVAEFEQGVQEFAQQLANRAPLALARIKRSIRMGINCGSFRDALLREAELQEELFATEDFQEGVTAFLSKRPPEFKGR
jgi:enoyl-CoA hydratase/carnithine racemase